MVKVFSPLIRLSSDGLATPYRIKPCYSLNISKTSFSANASQRPVYYILMLTMYSINVRLAIWKCLRDECSSCHRQLFLKKLNWCYVQKFCFDMSPSLYLDRKQKVHCRLNFHGVSVEYCLFCCGTHIIEKEKFQKNERDPFNKFFLRRMDGKKL